MANLKLTYPVFSLENDVLLPAGTVLTDAVLTEVAAASTASSAAHVSMLAHGTVAADLERFLRHPTYSLIFSDDDQLQLLFDQMSRVLLSDPLLKFLDYFKRMDHYTYRHTLTVFALSMLLAHVVIGDADGAVREAIGAPTHDFGKLCVPLPVLQKAEPLTAEERQHLEHHSIAGYVLLTFYSGSPQNPAAVAARDHHERKDGSGYPAGAALQDRMVEIVATADIFDALIARRPYRASSYDNRTALEHITTMGEEGQLSWEVIQALVSCNRKDPPHYSECRISLEKRGTPPQDNLYGVTAG